MHGVWLVVQWYPLASPKGFNGLKYQKRKKIITCKLFSYPISASDSNNLFVYWKFHLTFVQRERKEKKASNLAGACLMDFDGIDIWNDHVNKKSKYKPLVICHLSCVKK